MVVCTLNDFRRSQDVSAIIKKIGAIGPHNGRSVVEAGALQRLSVNQRLQKELWPAIKLKWLLGRTKSSVKGRSWD